MAHSFDLLLEDLRSSAQNRTRDLGTAFERLVKDFLLTDSTQSSLYKGVQTYAQWAREHSLPGEDYGIDLVAEKRDGSGFVAIQAKCFQPQRTVKKEDIDSFMNASSKKHFVGRMVVDTTEGAWSDGAYRMLENQKFLVQRLSLKEFRESNVDWNKLRKGGKAQRVARYTARSHQKKALKAVVQGLQLMDRGHVVMACGSGKTFTALLIAQKLAGKGGRVLYMVPSLSLMSQSIQKWHQQSEGLISFAVCSDTKVGKRAAKEGDTPYLDTFDMVIPPTTDAAKLIEHFPKKDSSTSMTVVFSTYQSLDVITEAQEGGLPEFDLVICDEAHRTTGATLAGEEEALFVRVHHNKYVQAKKRLYMTATPRIYADDTKEQANRENALLASMDDPKIYGKCLFTLSFGEAVNLGLLTDYKVVILAVEEEEVSAQAAHELARDSSELDLSSATKILGCFKALSKEWHPEGSKNPMRRALAFAKDIKTSKSVSQSFADVVESYHSSLEPDPTRLSIEVEHVDGTFDSKKRTDLVSWLENVPQDPDSPICRILSNARCLSEGVDIPALDGVIFLHPRKSLVDVVQSVGRVMRKAKGKEMGYIILPIGVPSSIEAHHALDQNKKYKVVWQILNALRAHDERLDATINQIQLGQDVSDRIAIHAGSKALKKMEITDTVESLPSLSLPAHHDLDIGGEAAEAPYAEAGLKENSQGLSPPWMSVVRTAITAKIVERCGTREYWDDWAQSATEIAQSHISRITGIIDPTLHPENRKIFERFLAEIRDDLNDSITESDAVEMLAQHIITRPIFQSLFSGRKFVDKNPVSKSMGTVLKTLDENGIHKESKDLTQFYDRIRIRSEGLTDPKAKQQLITELYDKFFAIAFPTTVQKLGIAYTPIEIVDFIIHSVNEVLQSEFQGKTLGSPGVHILDPYTGTGSFITRLLESGLMSPEEIKRKYLGDKEGPEIHANEIVLLAYYIAAINIETAYQGVMAESEEGDQGSEEEYASFPGICLTDTFGLHEKDDASSEFFPENSKRRMYQKSQRVQVIMGNPPYSVGQKSANDNAANTKYDRLDERIEDTYVKHSKATSNKALYNSYIRALRLGSDQINQAGGGVLAFITDAGWIESMGGAGIRHCVEREFSKIYVFHLRGDARKSGEAWEREGGKIFGQASRCPVAMSFFISDGKKKEKPAEIFFYDIGERLEREEKLSRVMELKSLQGITALGTEGWRKIQPDGHSDWLNHRDPGFSQLLALGGKRGEEKIYAFENYSKGICTARDTWCYNPSCSQLLNHMKGMISFYNQEVKRLHNALDQPSVAEIKKHASCTDSQIKWSRPLYKSASLGHTYPFNKKNAALSSYRPFVKNWLYFDRAFNECVYQIPHIFPLDPRSNQGTRENEVIMISGMGSSGGWSCQMLDCPPDLNFFTAGQCFPRYLYDPQTLERREAITGEALEHFQKKCQNSSITKEQIFYYIYGVFHSEKYRSRFAVNLKKELARVPVVETYKEFKAFSDKGRELAELHLGYEKAHNKLGQWCPGVEVEEKSVEKKESDPKAYYHVRRMSLGKGKDLSQIIYNAHITVKNIPKEAWAYEVNGRSALKWILQYQQIKTDKDSSITKDPNAYGLESGDSKYLLNLLLGVIAVSVRTRQLVKELPELRWSEDSGDQAQVTGIKAAPPSKNKSAAGREGGSSSSSKKVA